MRFRFKRRLSSLEFLLRRVYRRTITAKPSIFVVTAFLVSFLLFLLSGGIYEVFVKPPPVLASGGSILFLYPHVHEQSGFEFFLILPSFAMGAVGLFLMYQSTKYAYKPRQAYMLLFTGVVLLIIAYIYIENGLWGKLTGFA